MSQRALLLIAATFAAGAACSNLDTTKNANPTSVLGTDRQILVMLKESPLRHYRPGSFSQPSYGSGPAPTSQLRIARELGREYGFQVVSDWAMPSLGIRCFLGEVPAGRTPSELASRLAADSRVESAQPVQEFRSLGHSDPYYELQISAQIFKLDELHRIATGKHVSVAQIDTGVELKHPDLDGQLFDARNFVDGSRYAAESHGTGVAGIIVAKADNGIGIVGIAPAATLMPLRACWEVEGQPGAALCSSFTLAKALQFAIDNGAKVINLSLGGPRDRLVERLLAVAASRGAVIVAASDPRAGDGGFPASLPDVLAVAADDVHDAPEAIYLAPGRDIPTTLPGARWGFVGGSSYSAAQVSGLVALLVDLAPDQSTRQLRETLSTSDRAGASSRPRAIAVDACAAVARTVGACVCGCTFAHSSVAAPAVH